MSPQQGTVPTAATPASPDFSLLSFVADARAVVMLFSNGTVQVSDHTQRSRRERVTSERCETQGSYPVSSVLGNLLSLGTVSSGRG